MSMRALGALLAVGLTVPPLAAQGWRPGGDIPLVRAAVAARTARDRTAALAGWQAEAHGVVRFMARIDHGGSPVERVMKVDELRVEVYGEAPSRSKQRIVAWRDTVLQPTTIRYHRDHLGIVAHDFGPRIRLGQGEEVRDVDHPLSPAGLAAYEFQVGDSLSIVTGEDTLRVVAIDVRPLLRGGIGLVGTLYLDRDRAALVRLRFTFTPASYRDPTVERITVVLENALHERQQWLPDRQSIAIDRAAPWIALPLATRIVAEWEIGGYRLGLSHPVGRFAGAPVAGLQAPGGAPWTEPLPLAGLVGVEDDGAALADLGRDLVGRRLDGLPVVRLAATGGLGSLLRVNRVEGVAFGTGARWTPAAGLAATAEIGVATAGDRLSGGGELERRLGGVTWRLAASRQVTDLAADPAGSTLANSFATLVSGADSRDWLLRDRVAVEAEIGGGAAAVRLGVARESTRDLPARFTAIDGSRRPNPALGAGDATVVTLEARHEVATGTAARLRFEAGTKGVAWRRADLRLRSATGGIEATLEAGVGSDGLPVHRAFVLGGRGSLVGHPNRRWWGRRSLRLELARPVAIGVPLPGVPGVPSGAGLSSALAPFLAVGAVGGVVAGAPGQPSARLQASLGMRLDLWGPLLRVTLGWAPGPGRIGVTLDAHPDWWPLL